MVFEPTDGAGRARGPGVGVDDDFGVGETSAGSFLITLRLILEDLTYIMLLLMLQGKTVRSGCRDSLFWCEVGYLMSTTPNCL